MRKASDAHRSAIVYRPDAVPVLPESAADRTYPTQRFFLPPAIRAIGSMMKKKVQNEGPPDSGRILATRNPSNPAATMAPIYSLFFTGFSPFSVNLVSSTHPKTLTATQASPVVSRSGLFPAVFSAPRRPEWDRQPRTR